MVSGISSDYIFLCFKYSWKFVKASGGQIIEPRVLNSHKWNCDGLKHICGQGAVYIKALDTDEDVSDDEDDDRVTILLYY